VIDPIKKQRQVRAALRWLADLEVPLEEITRDYPAIVEERSRSAQLDLQLAVALAGLSS
jgi:hypothetical protein